MTPDPYECPTCGPDTLTVYETRARDGKRSNQVVRCTRCRRAWDVY